MNYSKKLYCLLLSDFPGLSITPFDNSLKPLFCIYIIKYYFINTVIDLDTTKLASNILCGKFQRITTAEFKFVSLSKVTLPPQVIVIGCIIFEIPILYDESISLTGIIDTNATSIGCYNIVFNDGTVSSNYNSSTNLLFYYCLLNIIFSLKLLR